MELNVVTHTNTARLPEKAHSGDLGYDIFADESVNLNPGERKLISTGISIKANNGKYGFIIKDRSSMAVKGLFSHAGVIDAGYTGEIKVLLYNGSNEYYEVVKGDKIAQMIPTPVIGFEIMEVSSHTNTDRGEGGFGSTGK
jgi:dUTP pyrophosphatase